MPYIIAIDQGTTSTRAMIFDEAARVHAVEQKELQLYYPDNGWVEQDAEAIWDDTVMLVRKALKSANFDISEIAAMGITNQRETSVLWDRATGKPLYRAIVWQDRRTADICAKLKEQGKEQMVQEKTGLLIDPYFSASKLSWILDNVPGAREKAARGELAFGTIDSYLLYRLTGGKVHATDATNASRTMLFNIHTQSWDDDLLYLFNIPTSLLPEVKDNAADYGTSEAALFNGPIKIAGMVGDQQGAAFGQACFSPGMIKSTYGTGCFVLANTGDQALKSHHKLLTTPAYRLGGKVSYALEGSIFNAGTVIQWIRDGLRLVRHANETEAIAKACSDNGGVYLVPAFTGLGAPHWDAEARGLISGLTRASNSEHLVRAALESVCYQTADLLSALTNDGLDVQTLRVDGGMVANNWLMQFLSDILNVQISRPAVTETTALGSAYLAGLQVGIYDSLDDISRHWREDQSFRPSMSQPQRQALLSGWQDAVMRTCSNTMQQIDEETAKSA